MRFLMTLALTAAFAGGNALAAKAVTTKKPRATFYQTVRVIDKYAGSVAVTPTLKVNGKSQATKIVKAAFVPLDDYGHACGKYAPGTIHGRTASFTAPHTGPAAITVVSTVRSARKQSGKYLQVRLTKTIVLGGDEYQCWTGEPPIAQVVCAYGYSGGPPSGNGSNFCGNPVAGAPFWEEKPMPYGNTVKLPHIGVASGYCWVDHTYFSPATVSWLGSPVKAMEAWMCSNGIRVQPNLSVYLTAPQTPTTKVLPVECHVDGYHTTSGFPDIPFGGGFYSFTVPSNWGGRMDLEWALTAYSVDARGKQTLLGIEWADNSFSPNWPKYPQGEIDGCAQLTAPNTTGH